MDVLLVSGRARTPHAHPSSELAKSIAADLARDGQDVRWICPTPSADQAAPELPDGARFIPVPSTVAPFRKVERSVDDGELDSALTREIRRQLPDVVHVLAYGGCSSALTVWIADRMGTPVVVSIDPRELLCHRSTLIDQSGARCHEWNQPARCVACCMTPFDGGLTPGQARAGRVLRVLGAWSPYPKDYEFENRLDLLVGGLTWATTILVEDEAARERLVAAGSPARAIRVTADPSDPKELLRFYAEANRLWAGSTDSPVEGSTQGTS